MNKLIVSHECRNYDHDSCRNNTCMCGCHYVDNNIVYTCRRCKASCNTLLEDEAKKRMCYKCRHILAVGKKVASKT